MQTGMKIGIGVGIAAGAVVAGGLASAAMAARRSEPHGHDHEHGTSAGDDPVTEPYPGDHVLVDPYPGSGTSPGDDPVDPRVSGHVDPPGWFDDYTYDGTLDGTQLDVEIDPRGWWNEIGARGRVDANGWDVTLDPPGWGNVQVSGTRTRSGYEGVVDRPGLWNDVQHAIRETGAGAGVTREGRFDERLVPSWSEATWRSFPADAARGTRTLEFDPPGWANTTRVTLDQPAPAGVEATIAAHLFDQWKLQLERDAADYPDPDYPDPDYPTAPGDDYPY
jgi:hypothetical protein